MQSLRMHLEQQARNSAHKAIPMGRLRVTPTIHSGASNKGTAKLEVDQDQHPQQQQQLDDESSQAYRPKRKATNAHIFRYLQTRNPGRLEEEDLKKALEASLEDCPDFGWPAEDTASCSSSDQSNAPSASSNSSTGGGCNSNKDCANSSINHHHHNNSTTKINRRSSLDKSSGPRPNNGKRSLKSSSSTMQLNHHTLCNCHINQHNNNNNSNHHYHPYQNSHPTTAASHKNGTSNHGLANVHSCPMFSVHNRYKPVGKKNIYNEADFFHDGIMEYIEFELLEKGLIR